VIPFENNTRIIQISERDTLIEQKPGYRTLRSYGKLFFPYMIFIFRQWSSVQTMHFGLRTEPISEENIRNEVLLFPPLTNIYARWLLCCCRANVNDFWMSYFDPAGYGWPGGCICPISDLKSYDRWRTLMPEECMKAFENYPKEIPGRRYDNVYFSSSCPDTFSARVSVSEVLSQVSQNELCHIERVSKRMEPYA